MKTLILAIIPTAIVSSLLWTYSDYLREVLNNNINISYMFFKPIILIFLLVKFFIIATLYGIVYSKLNIITFINKKNKLFVKNNIIKINNSIFYLSLLCFISSAIQVFSLENKFLLLMFSSVDFYFIFILILSLIKIHIHIHILYD